LIIIYILYLILIQYLEHFRKQLFFLNCNTEDWTQDFVLVGQLSHTPDLLHLVCFLDRVFCLGSLGPQASYLDLLSSWDYRCTNNKEVYCLFVCVETGSYSTAEVDLKLALLTQSLECSDDRHVPPCLIWRQFIEETIK
jgi:hypothetical protein